TLDQVWPLLSEILQQRLVPDEEDESTEWVLQQWLRSLLDGSSQLPQVSEQTLLRLLAAWCDLHVDNMSFVCLDCGLCRPNRKMVSNPQRFRDDPPAPEQAIWDGGWDYFKVCPHCQSARY